LDSLHARATAHAIAVSTGNCVQKGGGHDKLVLMAFLALLSSSAYAQEITTGNTVRVLADGGSGGQNATIWKADCQQGMLLTGIEIAVGGTCHNQCDRDGRPLATFVIHCSQIQTGK